MDHGVWLFREHQGALQQALDVLRCLHQTNGHSLQEQLLQVTTVPAGPCTSHLLELWHAFCKHVGSTSYLVVSAAAQQSTALVLMRMTDAPICTAWSRFCSSQCQCLGTQRYRAEQDETLLSCRHCQLTEQAISRQHSWPKESMQYEPAACAQEQAPLKHQGGW